MTTNVGHSFQQPPVVETALSIQFDELRDFRTIHFGLYHQTIEDRFPIAVDTPRMDRIVETFPSQPRVPALRIGPVSGRIERVWFKEAANGCSMLQLQPDRFAFNWCRKEGESYPRYATNQPKLFEEFDQFCDFASKNELGEVKPNLCEVTYVNHIFPKANETAAECFSAIFAGIRWESSDGWLPQPPETTLLNRVFVIGQQQGRLYAEAGIAHDEKREKFVHLKITARVIHNEGDDLRQNLNLAHDWVVNGFVSLTDEHARHERWEQES